MDRSCNLYNFFAYASELKMLTLLPRAKERTQPIRGLVRSSGHSPCSSLNYKTLHPGQLACREGHDINIWLGGLQQEVQIIFRGKIAHH